MKDLVPLFSRPISQERHGKPSTALECSPWKMPTQEVANDLGIRCERCGVSFDSEIWLQVDIADHCDTCDNLISNCSCRRTETNDKDSRPGSRQKHRAAYPPSSRRRSEGRAQSEPRDRPVSSTRPVGWWGCTCQIRDKESFEEHMRYCQLRPRSGFVCGGPLTRRDPGDASGTFDTRRSWLATFPARSAASASRRCFSQSTALSNPPRLAKAICHCVSSRYIQI